MFRSQAIPEAKASDKPWTIKAKSIEIVRTEIDVPQPNSANQNERPETKEVWWNKKEIWRITWLIASAVLACLSLNEFVKQSNIIQNPHVQLKYESNMEELSKVSSDMQNKLKNQDTILYAAQVLEWDESLSELRNLTQELFMEIGKASIEATNKELEATANFTNDIDSTNSVKIAEKRQKWSKNGIITGIVGLLWLGLWSPKKSPQRQSNIWTNIIGKKDDDTVVPFKKEEISKVKTAPKDTHEDTQEQPVIPEVAQAATKPFISKPKIQKPETNKEEHPNISAVLPNRKPVKENTPPNKTLKDNVDVNNKTRLEDHAEKLERIFILLWKKSEEAESMRPRFIKNIRNEIKNIEARSSSLSWIEKELFLFKCYLIYWMKLHPNQKNWNTEINILDTLIQRLKHKLESNPNLITELNANTQESFAA